MLESSAWISYCMHCYLLDILNQGKEKGERGSTQLRRVVCLRTSKCLNVGMFDIVIFIHVLRHDFSPFISFNGLFYWVWYLIYLYFTFRPKGEALWIIEVKLVIPVIMRAVLRKRP